MTIEEIALSKAQKRAILAARPLRPGEEELFLLAYRDCGKLVQSIHDLGLATIVMRGVMLNETGLALRTHLQSREP